MKLRYRIAGGLFAEFVYDPTARFPIAVNWEPERPQALRGAAWRHYQAARADFAHLIQQRLGRPLVLVETFDLAQSFLEDLQLMTATPAGRA